MKRLGLIILSFIVGGFVSTSHADDSNLGDMVQRNQVATFHDPMVVMKYCMASSQLLFFASSYIDGSYNNQNSNDPISKDSQEKFAQAADFLKLTNKQREFITKELINSPSQRAQIINSGNDYYDSCNVNPQEFMINYQYLVDHQK